MPLCTRKSSSFTVTLTALMCALLFAAASPALSQTSGTPAPAPKPILIVWAHTDLPNQGAPTLDVVDLERYFVTRLDARRIENVMRSATVQIPNPAPPHMYLLDLRVDVMQPADRTAWDSEHNTYRADPVFNVELSLSVKNLQSGQIVGATREPYEYHFGDYYEANRLEPKRLAIGRAADGLAEHFANLAVNGEFSEALKSIQAPRPSFWESLANGDKDAVSAAFVLGLFTLIAVLILIIIIANICRAIRGWTQRTADPCPPTLPTPPLPAADPEKDKFLKDVIALAEKTGNFSEEWLASEARQNSDVLLRDAEIIYARRAERTIRKKDHDKELEKVANYAARRHGLARADIYTKARWAENLQYELLRIAQKIVRARPSPKPAQAPPPPDPDKIEADRRAKARQQELEALEHERRKKEKELEAERVARQIRDSQTDLRAAEGPVTLDEAAQQRQEARRQAEAEANIAVDAAEAASDAVEKKVGLARSKCIRVFQNVDLRAGEKRAQIQGVLDSFGFKHDILPLAIQEFVEEGYQEAEQ
jgi:hypothetical protein